MIDGAEPSQKKTNQGSSLADLKSFVVEYLNVGPRVRFPLWLN